MRSVWTVVESPTEVIDCVMNQLPCSRVKLRVFWAMFRQLIVGEMTAAPSEGAAAVPEFRVTANSGSFRAEAAGMAGALRHGLPSTPTVEQIPGFGPGSVAP